MERSDHDSSVFADDRMPAVQIEHSVAHFVTQQSSVWVVDFQHSSKDSCCKMVESRNPLFHGFREEKKKEICDVYFLLRIFILLNFSLRVLFIFSLYFQKLEIILINFVKGH